MAGPDRPESGVVRIREGMKEYIFGYTSGQSCEPVTVWNTREGSILSGGLDRGPTPLVFFCCSFLFLPLSRLFLCPPPSPYSAE